ncbi:hypothetical protein BS78_07G220300 [Paspalum vaginatum]|nr:hypothetical protein BS78_07G220300 [Paspalum vaginatum]
MPPPPPPAEREAAGSEQMTILPDDQVFEVLTRVPLDGLAACRAVSARWRAITYEPAFAPLHRRRAGAASGYLVQSVTRSGHRADFVSSAAHPPNPPPLSLDFAPARYYLCKPATRQWRALPNPRLRFPTVATAMAARRRSPSADDRAVEFRIVRLSYVRGKYESMRCEVFDSRRFAWRRAADVPLRAGEPAVHAHGAAHWLCLPDRDRAAQCVFALDVGTGAWRLTALPREVEPEDVKTRDPWSHRQITAVEGRLCLMVTTTHDVGGGGEVLEVWEMASYAQARWEKKTRVSLKSFHEREGNSVILQHLDSSGVAFLDTCWRAMWYDFQRGSKIAEVQMDQGSLREIFKFESDMIPCQMGGRACRSPGSTNNFEGQWRDSSST